MPDKFAPAIARCLTYPDPPSPEQIGMVETVLAEGQGQPPDRAQLLELQARIDAAFPGGDRVALVYGGATKIKGYVFEAPKLPEIRGASALLDWVNEVELPRLWGASSPQEYVEKGIIYSSGGNILAFAPAAEGASRARLIEHLYTEHTLTANSVAVAETFSLIELRYGRLGYKAAANEFYWVEDFVEACDDARKRPLLKQYYYTLSNDFKQYDALKEKMPRTAAENDALERFRETFRQAFFQRKTFGELVTLLATLANQRRDERASHGDTRSLPFFPMIPWAEKCESSDVRPVVVTTLVGTDRRALSEPSGRKLVAGRIAKGNVYRFTDLERDLNWRVPNDLIAWGRTMSWERRWEAYINQDGRASRCGQNPAVGTNPRPAKDVHEIGAASGGYIGIIYADGNNVGRLVATLTIPEQYANVSRALSDAARLAVFRALADHIEPVASPPDDNARPYLYPFEILAIGGDDLFAIVPGDQALDIAAAIGTYFEAEIAKRLREIPGLELPANALSILGHRQRFAGSTALQQQDYTPLIGLSAGVIVAQETAPIFFLRDLVEELLKSAKGRAKENSKHSFYGGAVDFMVMKSITMVTDKIKSFRRQALGDDGDDSARRLTARPYTWDEFAGLLATVRALKQERVPRSQLYRLRRALDAEPGQAITPSVMEYLYTRTRMSPAYGNALLQHIEQPWCWETPAQGRATKLPPWMPLGKSGWETIWPDLLEAYEMVHVEEQP
jgi:CRISPR-associated protein Cmr2